MANSWKVLCIAGALAVTGFQVKAADEALIKRGEYLAIAGDCGACHTREGKAPFSGGFAIKSPLGTIFSTNITPSQKAGIGHYSEQQFAAALRKGVRADGSRLYPAMPYTAYARLSDDDVAALYAYFMHGVKPVDVAAEKTSLPFPFNLRFSMAAWNLLFLDDKPFQPDANQSAEWNRGAWLVQGLTHCGTCHTPRNFLMAEQQDKSLEGASLGTWYAPDITAATLRDKGHWTREMLANYLATGRASNGATAGGPMLEAIDKSFSRMKPEDLRAIAVYLLPQESAAAAVQRVRWTPVQGDDTPLAQPGEGERLYRSNCASCHNLAGQGLNGLPALQNHPLLSKPNADNVVMAILDGVWPKNGQGMIGFASTLTDSQIAAVTNYVMQDIGSSQVQISEARVKTLRNGGEASPLMLMARIGMAVGAAVFVLLAIYLWRRKRRHSTK
ncbi:cytochrome C [Pluralibacter gergoviae]|uniref:c-type cytochrome n=1 Tax=Pluralibacter gergoviae TaxID=61647 RepID=UPI0006502C7E|nr:c-type cytochrome [Pluralibacter gergoviae]KMK19745.1 cytochrome C [Pluralibacter gergoviae]